MADTAPEVTTLDERELHAATLTIEGKTRREVGTAMGLDHSTVVKILQRPHVSAWVTEVRKDMERAARTGLVRLVTPAIRVLGLALADKVPWQHRLDAAKTIVRAAIPAEVRTELTGRDGAPLQVEVLQVSTAVLDALGDEAEE